MKKEILTGLAALVLAGCSTIEPRGHIDISYVPMYSDNGPVTNVLKTELESGLETEINNTNLYIGGRSRTYSTKSTGVFFSPFRQGYDIFMEVELDNLLFYGTHTCSHPVSDNEFWVYDDDGKGYYINHDSITEWGIKYRW